MIVLERAREEDIDLIHNMQVNAFKPLLDKYQDYETNPGNESLEHVREKYNKDYANYFLIKNDNDVVGAVCVCKIKEHKKISPIFILPEYWNNGYASSAIRELEKIFGLDNWELDTILQEKGNCHLYEKMGYKQTGETKNINDKMTIVFYKK